MGGISDNSNNNQSSGGSKGLFGEIQNFPYTVGGLADLRRDLVPAYVKKSVEFWESAARPGPSTLIRRRRRFNVYIDLTG